MEAGAELEEGEPQAPAPPEATPSVQPSSVGGAVPEPELEPEVDPEPVEQQLLTRQSTRAQNTFKPLSESEYKKLVLDSPREPAAANSDWRATIRALDGLDPDDDLDETKRASQALALGQYRTLLEAGKFDELAVLVWTFGDDLNLPEVFSDVNKALLDDDPRRLAIYGGFMSALNRYVQAHPSCKMTTSRCSRAQQSLHSSAHRPKSWENMVFSEHLGTQPHRLTKSKPQGS